MSKKILIVEDCGDILNLLGEALHLLGWEPILAESGWEAISQLEHDVPSVVLLDTRTAVKDGVGLAAMLKAHPVYKKIPILAVHGYSGGLIREGYLAADCDDFICPPLALSALETRLTHLLSVERVKTVMATAL